MGLKGGGGGSQRLRMPGLGRITIPGGVPEAGRALGETPGSCSGGAEPSPGCQAELHLWGFQQVPPAEGWAPHRWHRPLPSPAASQCVAVECCAAHTAPCRMRTETFLTFCVNRTFGSKLKRKWFVLLSRKRCEKMSVFVAIYTLFMLFHKVVKLCIYCGE